MKLLKSFKEQIESIGPLKYVWLTSFNLSIEFVEMYLLPVVLEIEETPKSLFDYENIQLALIEKKIDFRVFCDKRFIEPGQNKRTTIPVHGVSPTRIKSFSKDSLFHPKVIYLEGTNGKKMLGSGSANLTVSGWGRNQEVFQFNEITTLDQYASVKSFFQILFENVGLECPLPNRRSFSSPNRDWSFVHSFQKESFLEQLFEGCETDQLLVWSPYLPLNLPAYISNLRQSLGINSLQIALVSDRVEGRYIRTQWSEALEKMIESQEVRFYENPSKLLDKVELCHSKVWILPERLAIGSWNFTGPGSNNLETDGNNIEAGFLIKTKLNWENEVGPSIHVDQNNFASIELLEEERLEIPKDLSFDIRVAFDWGKLTYEFYGEWNDGQVNDNYKIKVPGVPAIKLTWMPRAKVLNVSPRTVRNQIELLSEHRFEILKDECVVYRGLIIEKGLTFRRSQAYVTLSDLLDSFIFGSNPASDELTFVSKPINQDLDQLEESREDFEDALSSMSTISSDISYFQLFHATNQYSQKIVSVNTVGELNKLVFSLPGCLVELIEKAEVKLKEKEPSIFNWFLIQEVKTLCELAKKKKVMLGRSDESLPKLRWEMLEVTLPDLPGCIDASYVDLINKECRYVS